MAAKAGAYFTRAARLRCPVCGTKPIFPRAHTVRRPFDWFTPLDGCPRCGYAYEREPGYFLLAVWVIDCGCGSLLGALIYLALEFRADPPWYVLLPSVILPVLAFDVLFVRHAKALFMAIDHLLDPHVKGGDDDRGNRPRDIRPWEPEPPECKPGPVEPCESPGRVR